MPRTLDLLKAQLVAAGIGGGGMELIVLNTTTQEIPADTASIVAVPAGVQTVKSTLLNGS